MLRCIYCGFCEDACPTEAITLEADYEMTYLNRREAIYPKEKLIVPVPKGGKDTPQQVEPGTFDRSIPIMEDPKD
jgi:NADH-quinone oxidoreductase subunit I